MDRLIDPNTGDYVLSTDEAHLETIETLQNAVYISLITPLGTWWANRTIGSLLYTIVREKDLSRVGLLAIQYAQEALDHILKDGRAKTIDVTCSQPHNGTLILFIDVTDNRGQSAVFEHLVKVV